MNRAWIKKWGVALVGSVAIAGGVAGCSLSDSDNDSYKGNSGGSYKDPYGYGGGYGGKGYDPTASEGKYKDVPKGVPIVVDEKGPISWTVPQNGRVYITEGGTNNLKFTSKV